ncbi:MAG TPA: uroporphyrinogen decarboxylase family protein [Candidatus Acidoferrales bacterium]|nr:uroporphyrinogen decarboxylase family protein [Candidatus Acidoferrales bacterium]
MNPLQIIQGLLQGIAPPRPLFLPIVFSHGARVENIPLRAFLSNPTKISNALRQIRGRLRADGITCYFDPFLEAETLGAVVEWDAAGQSASLHLPKHAGGGEMPEGVPPGEPLRDSRVAVAVEVIRRLKALVRDDCVLMAGVTGPFTLGALLTHTASGSDVPPYREIPPAAMDLGAAVISGIAKAFVEAGADAILLREDVFPTLSVEDAADWAARLATTINIIRFYQALPVLLLTCARSVAANRELILGQPWECVVSTPLEGMHADRAAPGAVRGVALPVGAFEPGEAGEAVFEEALHSMRSAPKPAIVTTAGDVPAMADMERLNKLWENIRL